VGGGYDFAGDDYTGRNDPVPDSDPMDCAGHGTHVAGIVGASGQNEYNISGVASEATLYGYRIFGCDGFTSDDRESCTVATFGARSNFRTVIIAALLRGVNDTVDILTMSLGGSDGWTENAGAVVASRIAAQGIVVTISAGNDGDSGSWYTSSPGNAINAISVASIDKCVFLHIFFEEGRCTDT
jgi:subtilisin family serine protease